MDDVDDDEDDDAEAELDDEEGAAVRQDVSSAPSSAQSSRRSSHRGAAQDDVVPEAEQPGSPHRRDSQDLVATYAPFCRELLDGGGAPRPAAADQSAGVCFASR